MGWYERNFGYLAFMAALIFIVFKAIEIIAGLFR